MKKLFVVGMAALLLVAFSVPAMADVKIGGIIFTDFYYLDRNKDNLFNANRSKPGIDGSSYNNTAIQVPDITRFYARWTNEDNVGMYIEFGIGYTGNVEKVVTDKGQADNAVNVRHAYGWWDVNPMFQIMAGHSTTPFSPLNPSQLLGERSGSLNIIGVGYGDYYAGRFAQVRGTFKFGKVAKLEIALVDPNGAMPFGNQYPTTFAQQNTMIPRIDISVPLYLGPVHLYPGFLWQRRGVDFASNVTAHPDDNITTWIGTIGTKVGFGPFAFSGEFQYGENWGNTRGLAGASAPAQLASATLKTDNNINNAETYSWWVDLSYKFGSITPSLIYGQMKSKSLGAIAGYSGSATASSEAKSQMYGISVPIDLAKGFRLRPEIMWYDDGDLTVSGENDQNLGKYMIAGVQFQITF